MELERITLNGTIRGYLWMPCIETTERFSESFTPENSPFTHEWAGMRDALLRITNNGNFRNASIEECTAVIVYKNKVKKYVDILPCKAIDDLFHNFSTVIV